VVVIFLIMLAKRKKFT